MRIASVRPAFRRRPAAVLAVAGAVALAGCSTHPPQPISATALAAARSFKSYTVYWAGTAFDGLHLTDADSPFEFYAPVGFTMYYGTCEGRGILRDGGCTLPLKITTSIYTPHSDASFGPQQWVSLQGVPAVVYDGGRDIEMYTDKMDIDIVADSAARALTAAKALVPFNRTPSPSWPAFPEPSFTPNPQPVTAAPGSTGLTGSTGATSAITPPAELEPAPQTAGTTGTTGTTGA
jgi:hypothetical protein